MSGERPAFLEDAALVTADAWDRLAEGAARGRSAFHTPVLATVSAAGEPEARTVVLRGADRGDRRLICHTDARSPKTASVEHGPWGAWMFYDAENRVQVRARTRMQVHRDDALADRQWEATGLSSRRCYLAPAVPGAPTADGEPSPNLPPTVRGRVPEVQETLAGRANFAVLSGLVVALDVLHLHHAGHVRVQVAYESEDTRGHDPVFVEP